MSIGTFGDVIGAPTRERGSLLTTTHTVKPLAVTTTVERNETIDAIRAFAAAGIVFVHATESATFEKWGNIFRFGVPFFLFASLYFQSVSLRRNSHRPFRRYVIGRIERLYLPFVIWSLIYLLGRDVERLCIHHLGPVAPRFSMLWTGTEYHLWFLPFLLGWTVMLAALHKGMIRRDHRCRWLVMATAITVGCAVASVKFPPMPPASVLTADDPLYTYIQWVLSMPAACWALAFACFVALGPTIYAIPAALGWGGIGLTIACGLQQVLHGIEIGPRGLTGLGTMLTSLVPWKTSAIPALARLGRKGYGIYLCHVVPVEILHCAQHKLNLETSGWLDVATFSLSFLAAWGIVVLLGKSRRTAWLNG
jgi:surface polysaccharide O-acyltransferase-like enzyme